jgi:hypothetical protein
MSDPKKDNTEATAGTRPDSDDERNRKRAEAAAAKISPAVPAAGAAVLADTDPALDTESDVAGKAGKDRMTGEE